MKENIKTLKVSVISLWETPRGYGEKGACQLYSWGNGNMINFLTDQFGFWGAIRCYFKGTFKKDFFGNKGDFGSFLGTTGTQTPLRVPHYEDPLSKSSSFI